MAGVLLVAGVSLLALLWLRHSPFHAPEFTLSVMPADPADPPGQVTVCVTADHREAWNRWVGPNGRFEKAAEVLWIERIGAPGSARVFGSHRLDGSRLCFAPAVPLDPGWRYRIAFRPPGSDPSRPVRSTAKSVRGSVSGRGALELIYETRESPSDPQPQLLSIHPGASELPANHLKFYLSFSQPMEQGVFMERIKLNRDGSGEVAGAFRETELWSPDGKRLTVWLHPGRQKTGVNLNEEEGMVLQEGASYSLRIDGRWRATNGKPLGSDQAKAFRVVAADHSPIDASRWTVHPPKSGTRQPLRIEFREPLDWALLQNTITIESPLHPGIAGEIRVPDGEREWRFTPAAPWQAGAHRVVIDRRLEDLAGNNLDRSFEVDIEQPSVPPTPTTAAVPFIIDN